MSRIKAIKIKSTALDAPLKFVARNIERYQLYQSTNDKGEAFEEDRIYFEYDNLPHFLSLNNMTLIWLAKRGIDVSLNGLTSGSLNGYSIHFEIIKDRGSYPYYSPVRLVKPKK